MPDKGYAPNYRNAPRVERNDLIARWSARDELWGDRKLGLDDWTIRLVRAWRADEAMEIGDLELQEEANRWPYR